MSFEEQLKRYRAGELSDQEQENVARELEKFQAIQRYLDEEESKFIEMEAKGERTSGDEVIQIRRTVKKRVRKQYALIACLAIVCSVLTYQVGPTFIQNAAELYDRKRYGEHEYDGQYRGDGIFLRKEHQLTLDLSVWSELHTLARSVKMEGVEQDKNEMTYHYSFEYGNLTHERLRPVSYNTNIARPIQPELQTLVIERDLMTIEDRAPYDTKGKWREDAYVAFQFAKPLQLQQLLPVMGYLNQVSWYNFASQDKQPLGFRLDLDVFEMEKDDVLFYDPKRYPMLSYYKVDGYFPSDYPIEQYSAFVLQHVKSLLQYMDDQVEFRKAFHMQTDYGKALQEIERNGLKVYGGVVCVTEYTKPLLDKLVKEGVIQHTKQVELPEPVIK
ncbi:MAG: hypothetical protein ACRC5C_10770 [Bacilli bacterium]